MRTTIVKLVLWSLFLAVALTACHDEALHRWRFVSAALYEYEEPANKKLPEQGPGPLQLFVDSQIGPWPGELIGGPIFTDDASGESLLLDGLDDWVRVLGDDAQPSERLPAAELTVEAWVAVNRVERWGGIVSCLQDNGDAETGWLLGFENDHFTFALSSDGVDDPDGRLTYLTGGPAIELSRWHHVCGTYDGRSMRLFVDGAEVASSDEQSGPIRYPNAAPLALGAYRDRNEHYPLKGRLREVAILGRALAPDEVHDSFAAERALTESAPVADERLYFTVAPYLQFATSDSMTVVSEVSSSSTVTIDWGRTAELGESTTSDASDLIHTFTLDELEPDTRYFYRVSATSLDGRCELASEVLTFQTAVAPDAAFTFAVLGDTQAQPDVVAAVGERVWSLRPHFVVIAGDLVGTGTSKVDWVAHFFKNMADLIARRPVLPGARQPRAERGLVLPLYASAGPGVLLRLPLRQRSLLHDRCEQAARSDE